ncbi:amino acid adenylation domain-containing protein [Cellulomonas cellasea]|uniref:non-ribosomal peptide synthetase n=1 Tax=Cellulomonas cellasea TaxID=43670 RepID=UPI0025A38161|nr:non-ribosomal peptide synthetase [Cellulomonas cellasea]MDM8083677.1 amino acid adenylation domain-containing protein [Cellulomonas cellasea]
MSPTRTASEDLAAVAAATRLPLSAAQRSIIDAQALDPDSDVFVVADRVELTGHVSTALLARAIEETVGEVDALAFRVERDPATGEPSRAAVRAEAVVRVHDVSGETDPERAARALIDAELARGAGGLDAAEPIGQLVVRTGPERVVWLQRYHHVAVDGYAISLIARRVAERYRALAGGGGVGEGFGSLEALVEAEAAAREACSGAGIAALLDAGPSPLAADGTVPTVSGQRAPAVRRAIGVDLALPEESHEAVLRLTARDRRITWADVHTAAYAVFVARASGSGAVVLGIPFAARTTREAARTPSMSVTVLPLPVRVDPAQSLAGLAHRVAEGLAVLRRSQALRGEEIAAARGIPSLLRGPGVNLKPYTPVLDFGGARGELRTEAAGPVDDLDLSVTADERGVTLRVDANPDTYTVAEVERVAARYAGLLERLLADPDRPVGRVPALPRGEAGADGSEPAPEGGLDIVDVSQALARAAAAEPQAIAVRSGVDAVTFGGLHARVRALAERLVALGAGPERVVAVALPRGVDLVVALLAVPEAGAALTPVDLGYPAERIAFLLEDSAPVVVLTVAGSAAARHPRALILDDTGSLPDAVAAPDAPEVAHDPASLAYVVYTSGSTGRPKGVGVSRGALAYFLAHHAATLFGPTAARAGRRLRAAHTASFSFDSSWEQLLWLLLGHELVVFDEDDRRDARAIVEAIDAVGIDTLDVTPSFASALVDAGLLETAHTPELFLIGGEAAPADLWRRLSASGMACHNFYGPTEATVDALGAPVVGEHPRIGRALAGADALVLDAALQPVPVGVVGELYLGGPHLARGYQGRSALTATRFIADPRGGGRRLYRTGDLVRVEADGALTSHGRGDDQVKIRGHRVELGEVHDAVARLDGVGHAAACVRGAGGSTRLLAYVVPAPGADLHPARLLARLRETTPDHLVPHAVVLVDRLPLTAHGKLDVAALPEPGPVGAGGSAPETDAERLVCAAVGEVLGLVDVPVDVDIVTLGGDSITAIAIVSALRRAGWVARPRDLFAARTARGLAALLRPLAETRARARQAAWGPVPPTPVVRALERLAPGLDAVRAYAQSVVLHAPGADAPRLRAAVEALAQRHPVLGLVARPGPAGTAPGWALEIPAPTARQPIQVVAVGGADNADASSGVEALRSRLVGSLDPSSGRVVAVGLVAHDEAVVVAAHHLVVDGVSWRVIIRELGVLLGGGSLPTGEDAAWRERALALDALRPTPAEEAHWRALAERGCSVLPDPVPVYAASSASRVVRAAGPDVAEAVLTRLPSLLDARPDTVLAGALAAALREWRGVAAGGRLLVDWETHGRDPLHDGEDPSEGIGWFTTEFPVAIELPAGAPRADDPDLLAEAVRAARQARAEAPGDGFGAGVAAGQARPAVLLNYLGRFDGEAPAGAGVALLGDRPFDVHLPDGLGIGHALEVAVFVLPGDAGLEVEWTIAPGLADEAEALLAAWDRALAGLVVLGGRPDADAPATLIPADAALPGLAAAQIRAIEREHGPLRDIAPLSPMQEGLLFHALRDGEDDVYTTVTTVHLESTPHGDGRVDPIDAHGLAAAVEAVVRAHPQLGAAFVVDAAHRPVQLVPRRAAAEVTVHELGADAQRIVAAEIARRTDVGRPPLLRAHVAPTGPTSATLVLAAHHLLLDGWSTPILVDRVLDAAAGGRPADGWPALRRAVLAQVGPQVESQVEPQVEQGGDASREAWRAHLDGLAQASIVAPGASGPVRTRSVAVPLNPDAASRLLRTARVAGLTVSTVLTGAWAYVVAGALGSADVVVGVTTAGRGAAVEGVDGVVGLLSATVPARFRMRPGRPFGAQLRALQRERADLQDHESLPLADIEAVAGVGTLFDTLVVVENYPPGKPGTPGGLQVAGMAAAGSTHYAVGITALPGEGLRVELDHDEARVPAERAQRLATGLADVLERLADGLDLTPLALPAPDGAVVLVGPEPERTPQDGSGTCAVLRSLLRAAAAQPDAVSVRFRERAVTTAELTAMAGGIQAALEQAGAGPEHVVALTLPRGVEIVAAIIACLSAGAAYLPLDPALPPARMRALLDDAGVGLVVAARGSEAARLAAEAGLTVVDPADARPARLAPRAVPGAAAAYVIHTSGSTGRPKGVVLTRDALDTHFDGLRTGRHAELVERLRAREGRSCVVAVHSASFSFDTSLIQLHWAFAGHELVVLDEDERRDPALFTARARAADVIDVAPVLAEQLVAAGIADGVRPLPEILLGGEAVAPELWTALRERADRTRSLNLYGPTEATVDALGAVVADSEAPLIGAPVAGVTATILDPWLRPAPRGVAGELYLSGGQLARGYLGRPGLTAASFVAGPDGTRRYRTGDLVRAGADDQVEHLGRLDDQVKIAGHRIEPGEVEAALREIPGVAQAAAYADVPGPVASRLLAAVTGAGITADEVRRAVAQLLPQHLTPSQVLVLDALPVTTSGKVDRPALRDLAAQLGAVDAGRTVIAPATPQEEAVVSAVRAALGGGPVSVDDDFFALGGHSLTALRVIGALRAAGLTLGVKDVFEARVIGRIAQRAAPAAVAAPALAGGIVEPGLAAGALDQAARATPPPAGRVPVSSAQRRLLFLAELEGVSATYTVPVTFDVDGAVNAEALAAAWEGVVRRHPVLRTVYVRDDGGGFGAEALAEPPTSFAVVDLGPRAAAVDVDHVVAAEEARAFDVFGAPPVRCTLVASGQRAALVIAAHHVAVDEASFAVILEDLSALLHGQEPAPAVPFAVFAAEEERGDAAAAARWRERLAGIPAEVELPTDRPRPERASHRAHTVSAPVPAPLAERIAAVAAAEGATPLMVVQTAVATLWQALGAGDDIVLGSPVSTRLDERFARTVGYLVNTLPVRLDVSGGEHLAGLLGRTRRSVLDAWADAQTPFEEVVDAVAPPRSLSRHPLFQTMVTVEQPVGERLRLPGARAVERTAGADSARFDLAVRLRMGGAGEPGSLTLVAAADLYDPASARRLLERLLGWTAALLADPRRPVRAIDARLEDERRRPAVDSQVVAGDATLLGSLADAVAAWPDRLALAAVDERLDYGALATRVLALRDALRRAGIGPEDRVAVATGRGSELVVALLGVLATGAAYVPLDVDYPQARLQMMLDDADPALVLVDAGTRGAGRGRPELVLGEAEAPPATPASPVSPSHAADELRRAAAAAHGAATAYVIYTSGSTGRPKGVAVPRAALDAFLAHERAVLGLGADDRLLAVTTVSFDIAALEVFVPLMSGAAIVLADRAQVRDPDQLTALAARERCTLLQATPSLWRPLVEAHPEAWSRVAALVGGEALPADLAQAMRQRCRSVRNVYGPTEATVWATSAQVDAAPAMPSGTAMPPGTAMPIGVPFAGVGAQVLDPALRPVPDSVQGELYLSGTQVARGYLGRAGLTASRFVADPFGEPGGRLYRTGDVVRRDGSGVLHFLRRADDQVKVDGHRIELGEVEAALRELPGVRQAAAVVRPGPTGRDRLLGYVVPEPGMRIDGQAARDALAAGLPAAYVPRVVTVLDAIPLTLNGKVARGSLPEPATAERMLREPGTAAERAVVEAVAETLGLAAVSPDDGFFELGGDSISSIRLVALVRARGFALTPGLVFSHERLASLAAAATPLAPAPQRPARRTRARISARDLGSIERLLEDPR